jgi:hypothetical protein
MTERSLLEGLTVFGVFLDCGGSMLGDVWVRAWCGECGLVQDGLLYSGRGRAFPPWVPVPHVLVHCAGCGAVTRHVDEQV